MQDAIAIDLAASNHGSSKTVVGAERFKCHETGGNLRYGRSAESFRPIQLVDHIIFAEWTDHNPEARSGKTRTPDDSLYCLVHGGARSHVAKIIYE